MTAISLRAAPPVLRFGLSTLASVLLHVAVLWPVGLVMQSVVPPPPPMLEATLVAPVLATKKMEESPASDLAPPPSAVASSGHLRPDGLPVPAPTISPKPLPPRPLKGRALNTAMAALVKEDFYPREAIERGLEGDVIVLLTLTASGGVADAMVATSSGHAMLDAAALVAVRRIAGLPSAQRQVLLPVQFRLH
jgi:protein TonB